MYIIKNAFKCIGRSKGRNILIGVIVLVISVSACIGLSIRQAAEKAKAEALDELSVTASISIDRQYMMNKMRENSTGDTGSAEGKGGFDKSRFSSMLGSASSLSLEDYLKYSKAQSVSDFYYQMTVFANGTDDFSPVTTENESENSNNGNSNAANEKGAPAGDMKGGFTSADFQIVGYSEEAAMTSFTSGTASVTTGSVFEQNTESNDCIISEELALYNDISVGDKIIISNPNSEKETYTLNVVGLYTDTSSDENTFSPHRNNSTDPANKIYMSYTALSGIVSESEKNEDTAMTGSLSGTYVFSDAEAYYNFENEVRELGLDESYAVSSADISAYENSIAPLDTLSTTAGWFLIIILAIGAIILIVLNIFNVRERKYEIGVLTAMGVTKCKVAVQFLTEIFAVTLAAVIIGMGVGAVSSVPVANTLLASQIEAQTSKAQNIEKNFGRGGSPEDMAQNPPSMQNSKPSQPSQSSESNYISQISSATDFTVVLQMFGIAILLTLVSGAVSMLFIMRYEPLKILANRD